MRQLDQHYPVIKEQGAGLSNSLMGAPVDQLDLSSVTKALRAVSGEIVLENLIETLMVIAVKHAGAVRGLLLLPDAGELRVEAEATTENEAVKVSLRPLLAVSPGPSGVSSSLCLPDSGKRHLGGCFDSESVLHG